MIQLGCTSMLCGTQKALSDEPERASDQVELRGFEPLASSLRTRGRIVIDGRLSVASGQ
jgi:hypothetical protein